MPQHGVEASGAWSAFDLNPAAFRDLAETRAARATSIADVAARTSCSCPCRAGQVSVCLGDGGISASARPGTAVVDLSTTSAIAREVERELAEPGIAFADAPVARTREAARRAS